MKKTVRVIYLTYSLEPAGAERLIYALAKNLDPERYRSVVCSLKHGGLLVEELKKINVKVYLINKRRSIDLSAIRILRKILIDEHIDIIHTHNFSANLWGRIAALSLNTCRIIATEHSLPTRKGWVRKCIDRFLSRYTDRIISVSEAVRCSLIEQEGIKQHKIMTIHNGVNLKEFDNLRTPESVREELGISFNAPVVGIVGRLITDKGHKYFLDAARVVSRQIPETRFLVVGDGELRVGLEEYAKKCGLLDNVIFTGFRNDRLDIMNIFNVAILSSRREGLPVTLLEYMALKKAIIVTAVGGMPEVIQDGISGCVVPPMNHYKIADSILALIKNDEIRKKYMENALKRVTSDFTEETMVYKTQLLYEEVISS